MRVGTNSATFTIINACNYNIWPAILSNPGSPPLSPTGFILSQGDSLAISVPSTWSGQLWGRTQCAADAAGNFTCLTGDCGTSAVECGGGQLSPPATTANFTLTDGGPSSYLVSLVVGYNLPIMVVPQGGARSQNCETVGCVIDSNSNYFPQELRVTSATGSKTVALKSACGGASTAPADCNPNSNSNLFEKSCPQAQTSASDTSSSFTCQSVDYAVHFCPSGFQSTGGTGTGNIIPQDQNNNNGPSDGLYGKKQVNSNFIIGVGVAAAVIGIVLMIWIWRRYRKSKCELHPCTCTCCSIFSCSICVD
ncbi:Thaumatin [Parasponia andersonii]|uniref:Thaumatin n=1 Tax=Parasponia andersonii TaxID=3476 RepID=A0A2P5BXC9_PARAD|nr:Thaumatin [Parasponia andersonii]